MTEEIKTMMWLGRVCCTNGGVGGHVVAVVKADEGQVGHVWGKGQDEQDSHHAGHRRPPQTQCSDHEKREDTLTEIM